MKIINPEKNLLIGQEIFRKCAVVNLAFSLMFLFFLNFFAMLKIEQVVLALSMAIPIVLVLQFLVAPKIHKLISGKLNTEIERWKSGELTTDEERTDLFELLEVHPIKIAIEIFCVFMFGGHAICFLCFFLSAMNIDLKIVAWCWGAVIYGAYVAGIFGYFRTETVANKYAEKIIKDGISVSRVLDKKHYGMSFSKKCIFFILVPFCGMQVLGFIVFLQGYVEVNGHFLYPELQIVRLLFLLLLCSSILVVMVLMFHSTLKTNNNKLCKAIQDILDSYPKKDVERKAQYIPTNLNGKLQYNIFLLNVLIEKLTKVSDFSLDIGSNVLKSTDDLYEISKGFETAVSEQEKNIKDILMTMENANGMLDVIKSSTNKISETSAVINEDIVSIDMILKDAKVQVADIVEANVRTIETVGNFRRKVENIDDIVALIKDISEQTKIIAFNSELEAVATGTEGRNFHIIATETRRLANSIMDCINTIQAYVNSIEISAEKLTASSSRQTKNMEKETQMLHDLISHFDNIKGTSALTTEKTESITNIIGNQLFSFKALAETLQQVDGSLRGFSESVNSISDLAEDMKNVAENLSKF